MKSSNKKRILVVAESIDAEDSSGSKANVALIWNLYKAGFEVLVYHYTRRTIHLEDIPCISIKENRNSSLFLLSRIQRKLQHTFKINLAKHLEPIFGFSFTFLNDSKSIAAALKKEIDFQPDIILTLSKGASFRPHHAFLQLPEFHQKWMAYIHDPYPFHYYPEPYEWSEPGYQQKIKFFKEVAAKCKWVGYPSFLLAEWMEEHYEDFKNKRVIIPHQLNRKRKHSVVLPRWFDPERFNILHAGNLMKQRNPFPLLNAFKKFLSKNPQANAEARLLLVGSASYHLPDLKKMAHKIDQLFVSDGYVAYDEVMKLQEVASVNIILESVAVISPFLPGKFPHCIAANKPILYLGPEKSEGKRLLGEDYPYRAEADDTERISEIIELLYKEWKTSSEPSIMNWEDLKYYLSKDHLKNELHKILQQ
ncbi:glycosyltransferase family 4 protein [Antarcticibacterium arcticum]|uniref:Glycosyltransferase family 4 protein n=1 Tax=Antarcticibacterium arcticum TaxID=2585771 RepID=A0A5B8YJ48_9FLAO|nr:glycosyltransferase family 4 protein [Antarcticibacterium arcticum]QED37755.1 glycosyltransferase family 4 protein [Antarcticibacterium arcticum]